MLVTRYILTAFCNELKISNQQARLISNISYQSINTTSEKSPILIAHGVLGNKNNFNSISKKLSKETGRTVVSYDARNHGKSKHYDEMNVSLVSNDAIQLMDSLAIEKCVFLGHSMGGRTAMYTALHQPERIDKLIVVDATPAERFLPRIRGSTIQYVEAMMEVNWEGSESMSSARRNAELQLKSSIQDDGIRTFILTNIDEINPGEFGWRTNMEPILNYLKKCQNHLLHDDKVKPEPYHGDTLFLGGGNSNYIRPSDYHIIRNLFPKSVITHIPDCGHWVHHEKPQEFVENVAAFLS